MSDREWPPNEAHAHYQPQIDELIAENNELTARIAQLEYENESLRHSLIDCIRSIVDRALGKVDQ